MSIPTLDLQNLPSSELHRACCEWGFFALQGHEVDPQLCSDALEAMRTFFAQPLEAKNSIRRTASNCWGFYDAELTKNRPDWKEIVDIGEAADHGPLAGASPQWPHLAGFQPQMQALQAQLHRVGLLVVAAVVDALQANIKLDAVFAEHTSFLRLNHYPPCPDPAPQDQLLSAPEGAPEGHLGISHHTDAGALTVLLPDQRPGLQVLRGQRWHLVQPAADTLIINIGDVVQVWSNDLYPAPVHRVLTHPDQHRYSAPYFLNPGYDYTYAPLQSRQNGGHPPRYRPVNWGEFRAQRTAGDYADQGNEIQISDYKIGV